MKYHAVRCQTWQAKRGGRKVWWDIHPVDHTGKRLSPVATIHQFDLVEVVMNHLKRIDHERRVR